MRGALHKRITCHFRYPDCVTVCRGEWMLAWVQLQTCCTCRLQPLPLHARALREREAAGVLRVRKRMKKRNLRA